RRSSDLRRRRLPPRGAGGALDRAERAALRDDQDPPRRARRVSRRPRRPRPRPDRGGGRARGAAGARDRLLGQDGRRSAARGRGAPRVHAVAGRGRARPAPDPGVSRRRGEWRRRARGRRPLHRRGARADRSACRAAGRAGGGHAGRAAGMRVALVVLLALFGFGAAAAGWGTITPGESTTAAVKTEYGEPSKVTKLKAEG